MTSEISTDNIHDLIVQGMQEAANLERQRLLNEGQPILIWRDGKVVDISQELQLQEPPCQHPES